MLRITGIVCNICYFRCKKALNNYRYNYIILEINGVCGVQPMQALGSLRPAWQDSPVGGMNLSCVYMRKFIPLAGTVLF
jgi:hypothetical protein